MPIFFQQDIDDSTRLALWKIEEEAEFFLQTVSLQQEITHPHKRLQHLAGRYLLQWLFPGFPVEMILIADTKKPFLQNEAYHFSISHCGDFAAVIVSKTKRVGIDIEIPSDKVVRILGKFLHPIEKIMLDEWKTGTHLQYPTLLWCAKESMFKWWGLGQIDFSEMLRVSGNVPQPSGSLHGNFLKEEININFPIQYHIFSNLVLTWIATEVMLNVEC